CKVVQPDLTLGVVRDKSCGVPERTLCVDPPGLSGKNSSQVAQGARSRRIILCEFVRFSCRVFSLRGTLGFSSADTVSPSVPGVSEDGPGGRALRTESDGSLCARYGLSVEI